jgi:hypothetical protein
VKDGKGKTERVNNSERQREEKIEAGKDRERERQREGKTESEGQRAERRKIAACNHKAFEN